MRIPFVDLKAQYQSIKTEIDTAIGSVISETAFISGKYARIFEKEFSEYSNVKHIVACANGTDSIEILLKVIGVQPGDEVIVPALTWISTSEAVSSLGATPVFVDIDEFFLIDTSKIEAKITEKTKAIIPVHFYGQPADMKSIQKIAKKHDLKIIEDAAQSHGAEIDGVKIGNFGDAVSFSFYPGKNLGAYGDAGAMASNSEEIAIGARRIANHGQEGKHNHLMEGRNSRMDGLHAAVLSVKLNYIDAWTKSRIKIADWYNQAFENLPIETPKVKNGNTHVYHLYVIRASKRDALKKHLNEAGIDALLHYPTALPYLPCYADRGFKKEDFPQALKATEEILSLPMYPEMTERQVKFIAEKIAEFYAY